MRTLSSDPKRVGTTRSTTRSMGEKSYSKGTLNCDSSAGPGGGALRGTSEATTGAGSLRQPTTIAAIAIEPTVAKRRMNRLAKREGAGKGSGKLRRRRNAEQTAEGWPDRMTIQRQGRLGRIS